MSIKIKSIITHHSSWIDSLLDNIRVPVFVGGLFIIHVLYVVIALGLFSINAEYVNVLNSGVQLFICVFLLIRFHPFRHHVLQPSDAPIIFGSAMFLLTNLGITQYLYYNTSRRLKSVPVIGNVIGNIDKYKAELEEVEKNGK